MKYNFDRLHQSLAYLTPVEYVEGEVARISLRCYLCGQPAQGIDLFLRNWYSYTTCSYITTAYKYTITYYTFCGKLSKGRSRLELEGGITKPMVNQELLNYIKQQLQQGKKRAEIEEELLGTGWQEKAIEEAFNALGPPRPPAVTPLPSASSQVVIGQQRLDPKAVWLFFLSSFLVALFLSIMLGIFLSVFLGFSFLVLVFFLVCIGLAYGWAVLSYNAYRYELTQEGFKKESGVIWKKYVTIPYERIQNVDIHRGVLARMLGLSALQIFTAGMGGTKAEGELPGLSLEMAEQLSAELVMRAKSTRSGV